MSLFPSKRSYRPKNKHVVFMDDKTFISLHWTEQQRLKPNSKEPKPYRETGDSDTRLDNWEEPEGYDEPQNNE